MLGGESGARASPPDTGDVCSAVPHPPGDAQCDFGQAKAVIGGVEQTIHYFVLDLPHNDACFVKAYPAETTEAFCDGHVSAFSSLGGVPRSILYDSTTLAVAKILGDGRRKRTRVFSELVSHYLFEDRFGRPGKGNDKGKVEGCQGRREVRPSGGAKVYHAGVDVQRKCPQDRGSEGLEAGEAAVRSKRLRGRRQNAGRSPACSA